MSGFVSTRCPIEGDDDSFKSAELARDVIREELRISRKALKEIAAPYAWREGPDYSKDLFHRIRIAQSALDAIQEARRG